MELLPGIILIHLLACLSPGPDVFLVVRNSLRSGAASGIRTTLGILTGVACHIVLGITGISYLLTRGPVARNAIALAGGAWLIYIGGKELLQLRRRPAAPGPASADSFPNAGTGYWRQGLLVNLLNPKALLFFLSLFSVLLGPEVPLSVKLACGFAMVAVQFLAFSGVALLAGHPGFSSRWPLLQKWLDRVFSLVLMGLGLWIWTIFLLFNLA